MRLFKRLAAPLITLGLCLSPGVAAAGTDSDTFTVSATVLATCEVTANDLAFGNYNPIDAANLDAATTLSVTCTNGTPYTVAMDLGGGTGATTATRYMQQGANNLGYVLYRNAGRTDLWGSTVGTNTLAGTGTGSAATVNVYGRVPMQQSVPSGTYQDTITVSVAW